MDMIRQWKICMYINHLVLHETQVVLKLKCLVYSYIKETIQFNFIA
jgi:hypothetical protein